MGQFKATVQRSPRRRVSPSEALALVCAALAIAAGAAAWIADEQAGLLSANAPPTRAASSFDERFLPAAPPESLAPHMSPVAGRFVFAAFDTRIVAAKERLTRQLQFQDSQPDEAGPPASTSVPLPKARPVEARLETRNFTAQAGTPQPDQRTLFQKFSDLLPGRVTLASLTPGGGLFGRSPDLAALGYDGATAVYDISARAVYLPGGVTLEAHSGLGSRMDDPGHVHERMVGATPPGAYDLKPREKLFHGVRALRMLPVEADAALGRSGLLTHNYMLGPNGDSNGCVSIRNYERFLKAYDDGEITRLVVVASLGDAITASRRAPSPS